MSADDQTADRKPWAWGGDWRARIAERLAARGLRTVTELADSHPSSTLLELAGLIGPDVAAVQLRWLMLEEARASGTFEPTARSLLARSLRTLPGWPAGSDSESLWPAVSALSGWAAALGEEFDDITDPIVDTLLDRGLEPGWLPADGNDPILIEVFRSLWREPEAK